MTPIVSILPVITLIPSAGSVRPGLLQCKIRARGGFVYPAPAQLCIMLLKSKRLFEFGQDHEEIADQTVVGNLEDRRLLVLVDGDNHLGVFHAGKMLDGA